jgi:hypothetical protein
MAATATAAFKESHVAAWISVLVTWAASLPFQPSVDIGASVAGRTPDADERRAGAGPQRQHSGTNWSAGPGLPANG